MNIGLFSDTYFPQISGVATSIKTLKEALEQQGHSVFIFTTTDPHVDKNIVEPNIFRVASVPFVSFTDRRVAFRGLFQVAKIANEVKLDIVHTQTEFSMGLIGKYVAYSLKIPSVHTYHTMYEDYLHYVLNGHLLKPYHVKQFTKAYLYHMNGVIAPSRRVEDTLLRYGVKTPIRVIPTGVDISGINAAPVCDVRKQLGLSSSDYVILTLSRIAAEKKINRILDCLAILVDEFPNLKLVIAGDGPDVGPLKDQVLRLNLEKYVIFSGNVDHSNVANFYRMADLFVSASDTETQGLTYIESLSVGTPCVVYNTDYTRNIFDSYSLGSVFDTKQEMYDLIRSYILRTPNKADDSIFQKKLSEISAETFAKNVAEFYDDVIMQYKRIK